MNKLMTELAGTLQCGLQKIAELSQVSKVASAPTFDQGRALVAATDACRKLAHLNLMSTDAVDHTAATLVADHEAALQMFSEYVGALQPGNVSDVVSKQSELGTVTNRQVNSPESKPKSTRLRC